MDDKEELYIDLALFLVIIITLFYLSKMILIL